MPRISALLLTTTLVLVAAGCKRSDAPTHSPAASVPPPATAPAAPAVSIKDALAGMVGKFKQVQSYHAVMEMSGGQNGMHTEMDFVAPDRYRMKMGTGVEVIRIGKDAYMSMGGKTVKSNVPAPQEEQWQEVFEKNMQAMEVVEQGADNVDGVSARKVLVKQTTPQPVETTLWINHDDLPVKMVSNLTVQGKPMTTTITYSRYNDPTIQIDPPK